MNEKNNGNIPTHVPVDTSLLNVKEGLPQEKKDSISVITSPDESKTLLKLPSSTQSQSMGTGKNNEANKATHSNTGSDCEFKCQYCGRGFLFRNNLKCHLRTHIRDKKYTCNICEKSFIYKESLKNHMLLHSNELPYQCDICMKKFRDRSNRRKHVKNVHKFLLASAVSVGGSAVQTELAGPGKEQASTILPNTQPRRRRKTQAKKKELPLPTHTPPVTSSAGVIARPPKHTSQLYSTEVQSDIMPLPISLVPPQRHENYSDTEPIHIHQLHHSRQQLHYLNPPTLTQPNVIVYTKPKTEGTEATYNRTALNDDNGEPQSEGQHYFAGYDSHQEYVGLITSAALTTADPNTAYDSPATYVTSASLFKPSRNNEPMTRHQTPCVPAITQHYRHEQYSSQLLYSSPLMSMGEGFGAYESYWATAGSSSATPNAPPTTYPNQNVVTTSYYTHQGQTPTLPEGNLLNTEPNSTYQTAHPHVPGPAPQQQNHFYTDLAQFDLSRL